jgi:hypothetical protein
MRWVILLVVLTGCPGPGDDDPMPDAPIGSTTLRVAWQLDTTVPGPSGGDVTLDRVRFELDNLRVVGDAGPVSRAEVRLEWDRESTGVTLVFKDIPAGIYSRVVFEVDDDTRFDGTVIISGTEEDFRIDKLGEVDVAFDIDLELVPGDDRTLDVRIAVASVIAAIDFERLPVVSGRRELTQGDPQAAAVRDAIRAAFTTLASDAN